MSDATRQPARVLVVDDEPEACAALVAALSGPGLEATGAISADGALRAAGQAPPDIVVTDLRLDGCTGVELIERLRADLGELPVVIVSGYGSAGAYSEASRVRPVELLNKPVDLERLRQAVRSGLARRRRHDRFRDRLRRSTRRRRKAHDALSATCTDLGATCRDLQDRLARQSALIRYQAELMDCAGEDDTFARFFRLFVQRSGPVFGVALLCDENAELQMVGRFGVPVPDGPNFSQTLAMCMVNTVLERPEVAVVDAQEALHVFPPHLHRLLIGVTLLLVPLMVAPGQLIGLAVLYRKGEQPFTDDDLALAKMIAPATAAAAQKS